MGNHQNYRIDARADLGYTVSRVFLKESTYEPNH